MTVLPNCPGDETVSLEEWIMLKLKFYEMFVCQWIKLNKKNPKKFPLNMNADRWNLEFQKWMECPF